MLLFNANTFFSPFFIASSSTLVQKAQRELKGKKVGTPGNYCYPQSIAHSIAYKNLILEKYARGEECPLFAALVGSKADASEFQISCGGRLPHIMHARFALQLGLEPDFKAPHWLHQDHHDIWNKAAGFEVIPKEEEEEFQFGDSDSEEEL